MTETAATCAMCHFPLEDGQTGSMTDVGMMHDSEYTYDEGSCYDAYLGGTDPDPSYTEPTEGAPTMTDPNPTPNQCIAALRLGLTPWDVKESDDMMRRAGLNAHHKDDAASMFSDWADADRFIPTLVFSDGTIYRGMPRSQFTDACHVAVQDARSYVRAFHPEHAPRSYVEPTTYARCISHTRSDATSTPLYRNAIQAD